MDMSVRISVRPHGGRGLLKMECMCICVCFTNDFVRWWASCHHPLTRVSTASQIALLFPPNQTYCCFWQHNSYSFNYNANGKHCFILGLSVLFMSCDSVSKITLGKFGCSLVQKRKENPIIGFFHSFIHHTPHTSHAQDLLSPLPIPLSFNMLISIRLNSSDTRCG